MISAGGYPCGPLRSLRDMLDLEAISFVKAITGLRQFITDIDRFDASQPMLEKDRTDILLPHINELAAALAKVNARSALASATRLQRRLSETNSALLPYGALKAALLDIESRFADHLIDIKLFVLSEQEASFFDPADKLLGGIQPVEGFSRAYPNAAFEIEEAAKCIALQRSTAAVFHCMRALENGIKAICKMLDVPDATKPADKNWGVILKAIKDKIDEKWPKQTRLPNSQGARIEALYATLDAIKNPWRNATMHVETIYQPHEALHIARCTGVFMIELMKHCDEEGIAPEASPAKATVGGEIISDRSAAIRLSEEGK
jgi:hypothetical protein